MPIKYRMLLPTVLHMSSGVKSVEANPRASETPDCCNGVDTVQARPLSGQALRWAYVLLMAVGQRNRRSAQKIRMGASSTVGRRVIPNLTVVDAAKIRRA